MFRPPHVVDEHVQAALLSLDASYEILHLVGLQVVHSDGYAAPARLVHKGGRLLDRFGPVVLGALVARGAPYDLQLPEIDCHRCLLR